MAVLLASAVRATDVSAQEHAPAARPAPQPKQPGPEDGLKPRAPLPPPEFLPLCLRLIQQGRYADARAALAPVVADHPRWARARFYLALTYHKEYKYEQAKALYAKALEADPLYHTIRVFYGWCLYYLGDLDKAEAMFKSYLAVKPDYPDAVFALGLIAFDKDDVAAADKLIRRAIGLAEKAGEKVVEAKCRARLADVLVRTDDLPAARRELERSAELNPDNYETYFKLSRVLQRLGDEEGAERARRKHREVRDRVRATEPNGDRRPGE